jgi:hypothetical protein
LEESRLRSTVQELSQELENQVAHTRSMERELSRCQGELVLATAEVKRLEVEMERARNRETQLTSETILLNQKHQQVLIVTEKALDDANATIATQNQELAELDRMQKRYMAAEDELRTQKAALDQIKLQLLSQLDLTRSEHEKDKLNLAQQYSTERKEFVGHLDAAEAMVRQLRGELEQRMRAQAELVKKLATQVLVLF